MITKENLKSFLTIGLGFLQDNDNGEVFIKHFEGVDYTLSVDFARERIIYPEAVQADRDTTKNFSDNENFVVLECVCSLFSRGYKPKQIILEPKTPGGREDGYYYGDILVKNNEDCPYFLIECKTAGEEFDSAWKKTQQNGGQLFRYYNSYRKAEFLCLYSSDYVDGKVKPEYRLISMKDNENKLKDDAELRSFALIASENGSYEDFFHVWTETYEQDYETRGAFENNVPAFGIGKRNYSAQNDLRDVDNEEIKKKYNEFARILRQHNVGSHENAFDKLVNLFLAKVVDETNNPEDLHFYWKGTSYDDDFSLQDRLQRLYRDGMKKFLGEDVTYIENSEIDKAFRWVQNDIDATKRTIKDFFRQLKFFSDNDFSFISVHNKRLFHQNAIILRKVIKMLQDIRLRTKEENQNQLLGDLFEGFLNKGVKQSEGQFFTPMPIVRFIVSSLPLENIIKECADAPLAIDYACGAGHFLTEYDFRITEFAQKYHPEILINNYYANTIGIEKEYRLSKVSKVSAFMYGHDDTKIIYADALSQIESVKDGTFRVLVANPPYAVSGFLETLSEKERKRYKLFNDDINLEKNNAIETFFMERSAQLMEANGVAGIILPISVLNKRGIYSHAREIILQNFDIIALAKFDKNTFGKTNTSTVTMFLRRKETNTPQSDHYRHRILSWFNGQHNADEIYEDLDLLHAYCTHMEYSISEYLEFLSGRIAEGFMASEVVQGYRDSFFGSQRNAMADVCEKAKAIRTKFKNREKTKTYRQLSDDERKQIAQDAFIDFVKEIEKDKVYYFLLLYSAPCPVVLVNMPSDTTKGKKFLGYEWSDTKGNEGIKYLHVKSKKKHDDEDNDDGNAEDDDTMQQIRGINGIVTPLFNPANLYDPNKINSVIRQNFLGEEPKIPLELEDFVSIGNLVEMMDFKSTGFKKELKTNVSLKVEVSSRYPIVKLKNYCEKINPSKEEIRDLSKDTVVSFVEMASLGFGRINYKEDKTIKDLSDGGYTYFKENDVIIAKISPSMENGKCALATGLTNGLAFGSTEFHVIRGKSKAQSKFILEYLNREYIRQIAASNETGASGHRRVPEYFYSHMPIPNVPEDVLEKIANECVHIDGLHEKKEERMVAILTEMETLRKSVSGKQMRLKEIITFVTDRIPYTGITQESYITTDNMLQNFEGVRHYNGVPEAQNVIQYRKGDILLSNIRPYLKKIWQADRDGGCNPDVLVMRINSKTVESSFIFYQLRCDSFFDYIMEDVKGMKMPRGNKEHIEKYELSVPSLKEQLKISKRFSDLNNEYMKLHAEMRKLPELKQSILDKYIK